ncbi:MAG: TetR/AcrR family transcriptional regulator [Rhodobacteraceae bacterium]|nr:TetR/AcrR family transcriptional regulator [Paracoccaceae bacterium]
MSELPPPAEGRVARRQARNRNALIAAARRIMSEKGIDAATMAEIADLADVGAGTVYNYFKSKEDLAVAVLEDLMLDLALKIEKVTDTFDDPGQVYAFGVRTVIDAATGDLRWRQLLNRSEVMANAMFRQMGPFAMRDMENATRAGRFKVDDAALTWTMATHAIVGVALSVTAGDLPASVIDDCVVRLLCMTGIGREAAVELAGRDRPALAKD